MTIEDENRRLREALTNPAPQKLRQRIWDMLEGNAVAGNLRPGHIRGNGVPDLIWEWITTALAAEPAGGEAQDVYVSPAKIVEGIRSRTAPPPPPPQGVEEMNGEPDDRDAQIISEPLDPSELEEALSADKDDRGAEEWDLIELAAEKWLSTQGEEAKNICDCERSHNGMGMGPRECDCPAGNPPPPTQGEAEWVDRSLWTRKTATRSPPPQPTQDIRDTATGEPIWKPWESRTPPTQTEEETLKARVNELQTALLEPIPCDVKLPPNTILRKGVSFATLRAALYQRQGRNAEFAAEPTSGEGTAVQFKSADEQRAYAEAHGAGPPSPPTQGGEGEEETARDLSGVGCGCCEEEEEICRFFRDGYCQRQSDEINAALRQRADEARRAENEACAKIAALNPFAHPLNTASAIRARIAPT